MAGQRVGQVNPVAEMLGVSHKCVAPILGTPLIVRTLEVLKAHPHVGEIVVSIDEEAFDLVRQTIAPMAVMLSPAQTSITDSVYAAASAVSEGPYLITTADNVLIEAEVIDRIVAEVEAGAEALFLLARKADVMAAHPDGQRNYYDFADDSYANCNSYAISNLAVIESAEIFREGGQFMKNPRRIASAFGLWNLIRMRFGLVSLQKGMISVSRRLGIDIRPVILSNGEYAIDVDNERTYRVCEEILRRRAGAVAEQGDKKDG
nr:NTP transferase domain-containing protein [Pacificimonas pallii]